MDVYDWYCCQYVDVWWQYLLVLCVILIDTDQIGDTTGLMCKRGVGKYGKKNNKSPVSPANTFLCHQDTQNIDCCKRRPEKNHQYKAY